MAINFETDDPVKLLSAFKKAIDDKKVVTWSYDSDGDFTHIPDQWQYKAWMRPTIYTGRLTMNLIGKRSETTTPAIYGVYHGRFIEAMLTHCDSLFASSAATALATNSDLITKAA
jgi:hypothetical protein